MNEWTNDERTNEWTNEWSVDVLLLDEYTGAELISFDIVFSLIQSSPS